MSKIYFISGHRDITEEEFRVHYACDIMRAIFEGATFVVGDCKGVDAMAQKLLMENNADVTVYHMFTTPRYNARCKVKGGYRSDVERDYTMTLESTDDIAWTRPGRERSGTGNNIHRRKLQREGTLSWENINQIEANRFL